MTLRKALQRGLLGIPMGVFVGYTITIIIALFQYSTGIYQPVVPKLSEVTGNEIFAVIIQYLLCAALGFAFAVGSAVFEVEEWGITKQTVIHFLITTITLFPVAYINYWMQHTVSGILSYIAIFVGMYFVIWAIQYYFWKKRINEINQKMMGK